MRVPTPGCDISEEKMEQAPLEEQPSSLTHQETTAPQTTVASAELTDSDAKAAEEQKARAIAEEEEAKKKAAEEEQNNRAELEAARKAGEEAQRRAREEAERIEKEKLEILAREAEAREQKEKKELEEKERAKQAKMEEEKLERQRMEEEKKRVEESAKARAIARVQEMQNKILAEEIERAQMEEDAKKKDAEPPAKRMKLQATPESDKVPAPLVPQVQEAKTDSVSVGAPTSAEPMQVDGSDKKETNKDEDVVALEPVSKKAKTAVEASKPVEKKPVEKKEDKKEEKKHKHHHHHHHSKDKKDNKKEEKKEKKETKKETKKRKTPEKKEAAPKKKITFFKGRSYKPIRSGVKHELSSKTAEEIAELKEEERLDDIQRAEFHKELDEELAKINGETVAKPEHIEKPAALKHQAPDVVLVDSDEDAKSLDKKIDERVEELKKLDTKEGPESTPQPSARSDKFDNEVKLKKRKSQEKAKSVQEEEAIKDIPTRLVQILQVATVEHMPKACGTCMNCKNKHDKCFWQLVFDAGHAARKYPAGLAFNRYYRLLFGGTLSNLINMKEIEQPEKWKVLFAFCNNVSREFSENQHLAPLGPFVRDGLETLMYNLALENSK